MWCGREHLTMARRRGPTERKLRTREHVLADLSANYVEKQALLCGFTTRREQQDYGIDLVVQTFNKRGEVESSRIHFQLKATDRLTLRADGHSITLRIERADLAHWLAEPIPVVLVVYQAKTDVAYWLYVQHHFQSLADFDLARCGARISVSIPLANVLNRKAMLALARAKNAIAMKFRGVLRHDL